MSQKILAVAWRAGTNCIGFVAVERVDGWKAYVGLGAGFDSAQDARLIAAHGSALMEPEARAFFPQFAERPYAL